jgi:hypothetical protein
MPVDSLGQLHDFLRSQGLIRRREHGNDELVHPAGRSRAGWVTGGRGSLSRRIAAAAVVMRRSSTPT